MSLVIELLTRQYFQLLTGTIPWPGFLLPSRLSACATTMHTQFPYERRHCATMVEIRHGLATLNSNNSVVYGQKHKVWVIVFIVSTSG